MDLWQKPTEFIRQFNIYAHIFTREVPLKSKKQILYCTVAWSFSDLWTCLSGTLSWVYFTYPYLFPVTFVQSEKYLIYFTIAPSLKSLLKLNVEIRRMIGLRLNASDLGAKFGTCLVFALLCSVCSNPCCRSLTVKSEECSWPEQFVS